MTSELTSKPPIARLETSSISNGPSLNHVPSAGPSSNLLSSNSNNNNTSTAINSPASASKTAAFFGESHIIQPPKSHFRSVSNSSSSSANPSSGSRLGRSGSRSDSSSISKADEPSLVSTSNEIEGSSANTSSTERGERIGQAAANLPASDSRLSIQSLESASDLDRSWSRNDLSSNSLVNSKSKPDFNSFSNASDPNQFPMSSSSSYSSRWAGGFGSSLQPQPQSSNSLYDGNQMQSGATSSFGNGSVRSRRNWDEFEGKSITPLPSPNLSTANNRFDFGSASASTSNDSNEESNLSAVGFGLGKQSSIGNLSTIPSSSSSSSTSSSEAPSKTESFFKSSTTPRPPTNKKSSGSLDYSSGQDEVTHLDHSSASRSNSALENRFHLHQTTRLPTLPTGNHITGGSSMNPSSVLSPSFRNGSTSNGSWLESGHMRSSSADWDPDLRSGNFSDSPVVISSSRRFFNGPSSSQKESGWGTLSSGYSPTSSRLNGSRSGREDQETGKSRSSGSSLSNSSMDLLMVSEGNGRRSGGGNTSRHTHGPSENASGSSLIPNFFTDSQTSSDLQEDYSAHRRGKSKEGLPTTSDGSNSLLFKSQHHDSPRSANLNLDKHSLKVQTSFNLPSSSHSPDERIGRSDKSKETKEADPVEAEDETQGLIGPYKVVSVLGVGAFSKVVLGERFQDFKGKQKMDLDAGSESSPSSLSRLVHSNEDYLDAPEVFVRRPSVTNEEREKELIRISTQTRASPSSPTSQREGPPEERRMNRLGSNGRIRGEDRLVALKIMAREPCQQNERMRVSWVREVEVLKHISHPSLVKFISSFSTPSQHVLVIERIEGGELFDLLDKNQVEVSKREWLVRRLYAEMANAVGWMHSVNLVHRDLKLENVLLTTRLFEVSRPLLPSSLPPIPLLKITDFGLSRFVDPNGPLLETRCGSEEYAAPELIIGKRYDGRQTDVWALGVVLYALLTGSIPFLDDNPAQTNNNGGSGKNSREDSTVERDSKQRKSHLLRIAKGDLRWPSRTNDSSKDVITDEEQDCPQVNRLITPRARNFISKLLRRDSSKRISAWESWDDPWLIEGSFLGTEHSQHGEQFDIEVRDPRSPEGKKWLRENAGVGGEKLSGVVLDD